MRLRRSNPARPGIRRVGRGRGFSYEQAGRPVTDAGTLARIRALVLPPAWREVWICPDDRGHLQATGVDAAGRTQYRYHDAWRTSRDARKFEHVTEVAGTLDRLRRTVATDLGRRGLTERRVLAAAARLLDLAALRVGGEAYAHDDDIGEATFGLATLRRDHVRVHGDRIRFCFPAKGGVETERVVDDAGLAAVVRALLRRRDPNEELLGYWDGKRWRDVHGAEVNAYLRDAAGIDLTAKDFRTWHGTVGAAVALAIDGPAETVIAQRRGIAQAMRQVAELLGNTPSVARKSYVDTRVVEQYRRGHTIAGVGRIADVASAAADRRTWSRAERSVRSLLGAA